MRNPGLTAAICAFGVVICGWPIVFPGPETPSSSVAILQWVLLAGCAIGLVGSLVRMANRR